MFYKIGNTRIRPELVAWWKLHDVAPDGIETPVLVVAFTGGGPAAAVAGPDALALLAVLERDFGPDVTAGRQ